MTNRLVQRWLHASTVVPAPWGWPRVACMVLLCGVLFPNLGVAVAKLAVPGLSPWSGRFLGTMVMHVAWLAAFVSLLRKYPGAEVQTVLGLRLTKSPKVSVLLGVYTAGVIVLLGWVLAWGAMGLHWSVEQPYAAVPPSHRGGLLLIGLGIAPLMEELIFRGLVQGTLYRYLSPEGAVLITALLFTLSHVLYFGHWLALLNVFLLALILGIVRHLSQSIWPGLLGHGLNNLLAIWLLFRGL